jgi:hypothetical protein
MSFANEQNMILKEWRRGKRKITGGELGHILQFHTK